ncbi:11635_t:CDS:2 [Scutellospora calospora]|uniref:11635_t:CDS:1 n=1 Tax=Scutellospora calospora TaxID=85575 RepID=A0ACA9KTW8_9GLOM|nr:11635_t:CDS:2 [Scutellospora calospora]
MCLSTVVVTEEEKLVLTFTDVFGFVGGFFTLATLIFVQLFGESTRRPWGIVQSLYCCGIKRSIQNTLYDHLKGHIPFADKGIHLEFPPERIEDRINAIEQRHKALELFLQDYVINVDFLYNNEYSKIKNVEILKN